MTAERPELSKEMKKEELKASIKQLEKREQALLDSLSRFGEDLIMVVERLEMEEAQKGLEFVREEMKKLQVQIDEIK